MSAGAPMAAVRALRPRLVRAMPALRTGGFVAGVAIVIAVGVAAARDVDLSRLHWGLLVPAAVAAIAWWLGLGRGWALLVSGRSTAHDVSTWCRTQTLRYLPGGFWAPASRGTIISGRPLDRIATVAAENVIALCAALAIGGVALTLAGRWWFAPLAATLAVPFVAVRVLGDRSRVSVPRTTHATVNYVAAFLAYAVAAVLTQAAVSGWHAPLEVAGVATIAWGAGLVVVIAPGGVGVREVVYFALLHDAFPHGRLLAAAVTMRIVMIVAELVVLLVAGRPTKQPVAAA